MGGQTATTAPPDYVVPHVQRLFGRAEELASKPFQAYGGQTVAGFAPQQEQALQMMQQQALAGDPGTEAALGAYQQTVGGDYLGSNPYLDDMFKRAAGQVTEQYQTAIAPQAAAAASRAGALGGSAYNELQGIQAGQLGNTLGGLATDIYGGAYERERGRQQQALGLAPMFNQLGGYQAQQLGQVGEQRQALEQRQLEDAYQRFMREQEHPYRQLDVLAQAIGAGTGAAGQTQRTSKGLI